MKEGRLQVLNPVYWVFHDKESTDVFLSTADKCLMDSQDKAQLECPNEFSIWLENVEDDCRYVFSKIELILVRD
jgi:hypothetical protein